MLLSAAMIVRDEATHLDACLATLAGLVDEIVVVDTGSIDDSVAIARRHGAVVEHLPWTGDFSAPRNRALDLARGEWILYVDADERVAPTDVDALRRLLRAADDHAAFRVRFVPRIGWTPYREYRLWRHQPDIRFRGVIHESMVPAIVAVAERERQVISDLDTLTIQHLGYEGDQRHKHARNEPMLRAAIEQDPERLFLYDHLARILEDLGRDAEARAVWRTGIEVARRAATTLPDEILLWVDLLVHALTRDDPDDDIVVLLGEARARYPGNPSVEFATAAHDLTTGDPAAAERRFLALTELDLDTIVDTGAAYDGRIFGAWAWNGIGLARFALGDDAGALEAFRNAEAADPENEAYRTRRRLAEVRAAAGRTTSAGS